MEQFQHFSVSYTLDQNENALHDTTMSERIDNYRAILLDNYNRRKARNSSYSLRAFGRDLGLSSSRLSEILSGKTGISLNRGIGIAQRLGLEGDEKNLFLDLIEAEHARSGISRSLARQRLLLRKKNTLTSLTMDQLELSKICLILLFYLKASPGIQVSEISRFWKFNTENLGEALAALESLGLIKLKQNVWKLANSGFEPLPLQIS